MSLLASAASLRTFFQLTDIHVDRTHECSGTNSTWYGSWEGNGDKGCGCTMKTVNETLAYMRRAVPVNETDFIFFTGDAPWGGDLLETIALLHDAMAAQYPTTPIYFVLGNHDFPGAPLGSDATDWYPKIAKIWGNWLDANATKLFAERGYYSTLLRGSNDVRLVGLNTEVFNHDNPHVFGLETMDLAMEQLDWLDATLAACAKHGEKALIFGHIPPGYESTYINDVSQPAPGYYKQNMMETYVSRLTAIADAHADAIGLMAFGHEHVDQFRLAGAESVVFTAPSLSTGYPRTNPTFRAWHHERGVVEDFSQFHWDLEASNAARTPRIERSYRFSEQYGLRNLTRPAVAALLDRFKAERAGAAETHAYEQERRFFMSSSPLEVQPACDRWCQVLDLCDKEFGAVVSGAPPTISTCLAWNGVLELNRTRA